MKIMTILTAIIAVMPICGSAATVTPKANATRNEERKKSVNEAERRAKWEQNFMKRYGGLCEKPGSQQGKVVFVDGQSKVDGEFIRRQVAAIEDFTRIKAEYTKSSGISIGGAMAELRAKGAQLAVFVVDDAVLPSLLTAPEAKWAFVNVGCLSGDGANDERIKARLRKELWRAFAYTAGCGDSTDARSVVQPVATLSDLDAIVVENFDPIQMQGLLKNLSKVGVSPKHIAPYKTACLRGWAPAPTNEFQKAIWEQVHAVPKNPMTIEFDPKKGK